MAIAYVPGLATRNGLSAAYLAKAAFTCSDIAIDGRNGLFELVAPHADVATMVRDLHLATEFQANSYKPYPCGIVIHPAIDACLEIVERHALSSDRIDRVDLNVHPDAIRLTWRKLPSNEFDAQVSLYHWVAATLVFGKAGLEQGELSAVQNPAVRALQERLFVQTVETLGSDAAEVTVRLKTGETYRASVEHATGSVARPMTCSELDAKFMALAARALNPSGNTDGSRERALLAACRQIDSCDDVAVISRLGAL